MILPDISFQNPNRLNLLKVRERPMNDRKKLIELFIYIAIVVVGVILLITANVQNTNKNDTDITGGTEYAAVFSE